MAAVNRYTTPREGLVAKPLSFEDYTRAGTVRADTLGKLAEFTGTDLGYDVDIKDNEFVSQQVAGIQGGIDQVSNDIAKGNITASTVDDALATKREQMKVFGQDGVVRKAEDNFKLKNLWENNVKLLAAEQKWTANELDTVLRTGNERFTGTFNQDGTSNVFKPEFGPGHIDYRQELSDRFARIANVTSEETLKGIEDKSLQFSTTKVPGKVVLVNQTTGKVVTNEPALTSELEAIMTEINDPTTVFGSNISYFDDENQSLLSSTGKLASDIMQSFVSTQITPPQTKLSLSNDQLLLNELAAKRKSEEDKFRPSTITGKSFRVNRKQVNHSSQLKYGNAGRDFLNAYEKGEAKRITDITSGGKREEPIGKTIPTTVTVGGQRGGGFSNSIEGTGGTYQTTKEVGSEPVYATGYEKELKAALDYITSNPVNGYQKRIGIDKPKEFYMKAVELNNGDIVQMIDEEKVKNKVIELRDTFETPLDIDIAPVIITSNTAVAIGGTKNEENLGSKKLYADLQEKAGTTNRKVYPVDPENTDVQDMTTLAALGGTGYVVGEIKNTFINALNADGVYDENLLGRTRVGINVDGVISYYDVDASDYDKSNIHPLQHDANRYMASVDVLDPKPLWVSNIVINEETGAKEEVPELVQVVATSTGNSPTGLIVIDNNGEFVREVRSDEINNSAAINANINAGYTLTKEEYNTSLSGPNSL